MSVRGSDQAILLEGDCPVEDAELLLEWLQKAPTVAVDWTRCTRLHTAVLQVVLAAARPVAGPCGDPWLRHWLERDLRPA